MGMAHTDEENDALAELKARARVHLDRFYRRWIRKGAKLVLAKMAKTPNKDPLEVGDAAFAEAGEELGFLSEGEFRGYLPKGKAK